MRTLFALAAVAGIVSAGNLFTYTGTSHFNLEQFVDPADMPALIPAGNYTNKTIFS